MNHDAAADRPGEQLGHPAQLGIQIDRRHHQRLPPGESEQLPGQFFAALDRAQRHIDPGLQLIIHLPPAEHFESTLQYSQQIVEVVRDPARQLAERLHLLRLTELGLGLGSPAHLAPQTPRRGAPAPAGDRVPLDLPDGEQRHPEQRERGRHRKQRVID